MPFESKAQARAAFAGAIPGFSKQRAQRWAGKTDFASLPEKKALLEALTDPAFMQKLAALGSSVTSSSGVGRMSGVMTENALKPPGRAESASVVDPRRSLKNAINVLK